MSEGLTIRRVSATWIEIDCEHGIAAELRDAFTFEAPNARFDPRVRAGIWDGKIRLFDTRNYRIYAGLIEKVEEFARDRDYPVFYDGVSGDAEFSLTQAKHAIEEMDLPKPPRDFQALSFVHSVRKGRRLIVSPTASGKSLIVHMLLAHYMRRSLVIVPTINLVGQMYANLLEYGWPAEHLCRIYSGADDSRDAMVWISTWHSLAKKKLPEFGVLIGDEAHGFKANEMRKIVEGMTTTDHRFGLTGTLDGTVTNKLVLEGLFGPIYQATTTKALIKRGTIADPKIKCITLKHPEDACKALRRRQKDALDAGCDKSEFYRIEQDHILSYEPRNRFLTNLALSLKGNTILLFQYVERHGKPLFERLSTQSAKRVYYVSGEVGAEDREQIRQIMQTEQDAIIVASNGTFATGVDIPTLNNLILASGGKGRIRLLQSLGRVLRRAEGKDRATIYDVADDLMTPKMKTPNYSLRHLAERVKTYAREQLDYKMYRVEIGNMV